MRKWIQILIVVMMALWLSACNTVLEYPDDDVEAVDPTLVTLDINIEISLEAYLEFQLYESPVKSEESEGIYLRTIIELYDKEDLSTPMITQTDYTLYSEIEEYNLDFLPILVLRSTPWLFGVI